MGRARHDDAEYQGSWSSQYRADLCVLVAGGTAYSSSEWLVISSLWLGPRAQGQEFEGTAHA